FLLAALFVMIRLQKMNYNFFGLLGSAALTIGVEMTLDRLIGMNFSTPIAVVVLIACITWVTRAEHVDVGFTVGVSFALTFGMNLWLLGALLGDLRVKAKSNDESGPEMNQTNQVAEVSAPATNSVEFLESQAKQFARTTADGLSLKGITQSATKPMAIIHTGTKSFTVVVGESFPVDTPKGKIDVTCKKVESDKVVLEIEGEEATLSFSLK